MKPVTTDTLLRRRCQKILAEHRRRAKADYGSGVSDFDKKARMSAAAMQIRKPRIIAIVAIDWVMSILPRSSTFYQL